MEAWPRALVLAGSSPGASSASELRRKQRRRGKVCLSISRGGKESHSEVGETQSATAQSWEQEEGWWGWGGWGGGRLQATVICRPGDC